MTALTEALIITHIQSTWNVGTVAAPGGYRSNQRIQSHSNKLIVKLVRSVPSWYGENAMSYVETWRFRLSHSNQIANDELVRCLLLYPGLAEIPEFDIDARPIDARGLYGWITIMKTTRLA